MPAPIVFVDFAGPDAKKLQDFYSALFDWNADAPTFPVPVSSPLQAAIRADPAEKRIYVGVADVAAKLVEVEQRGGAIDKPRFEVPGVVVLGLFRDPAGNPMGLVEMDGDDVRIP